jgi:hypothetical protein
MRHSGRRAAVAAVAAVCGVVLLVSVQRDRGATAALQLLRLPGGQLLATRQEEEEVGAINSWNSKGTMYIKTDGMFAAGTHGMNAGGAGLMPSAPGGLGYPRPAITESKFTPIDEEMQGDCVCEQPWKDHDHVVFKEIVCHCPRYMVPEPMQFPGNPPPPSELVYDDGCKCVVTADNKGTTCTCPIQQVDGWDYDAHPPLPEER